MSTYWKTTKHPETGKWEKATWHDDHFGKHHYGVEFPDGSMWDPWETEFETREGDPTQKPVLPEKVEKRIDDVLSICTGMSDELKNGVKKAVAQELTTARAEERKRIKNAWDKLNIVGGAASGSSQGLIVRNPWGETDSMQVDREAFKEFIKAITSQGAA